MATIIYVRKGSKAYNTASSREVSVADVLNLYGPEPSNYMHMKGAGPTDIHADKGPAKFFSDPAHVVVKIDRDEINQEIFPEDGFYIVKEAKP
ncbi:MAG: hypothetical protein AMJ60_10975 [Desulfobacterales bacterium SG8_35]|nr:MAG: hypothetical protein AMJ60_10975 [Desulfobacterales bacterium SG8_35]